MKPIESVSYSFGSPEDAHIYLGQAKKTLKLLEERMSFKQLPTGEKTTTLPDGTVIVATANYGIKKVTVKRPTAYRKEPKKDICLCGKYFAEGRVVDVVPVEGYHVPAQLYTVDVCQGDHFIRVENCVAQSFHEFFEGDQVWCCLTIREVIATKPYAYATTVDQFAYSCCYGAMATERGYQSVYEPAGGETNYSQGEGQRAFIRGFVDETAYYNDANLGVGNVPPWDYETHRAVIGFFGLGVDRFYYSYDSQTATISANSVLVTGLAPSTPDDEFGGSYPWMCSLKPDISDSFWMCNDSAVNGLLDMRKVAHGLYCEYAMLETISTGSGGAKPTFNTGSQTDIDYLFNLQIIEKATTR